MNIFALDQCPMQSALWLDDIRKNKMILESAQMLSTAVRTLCPDTDLEVYRVAYLNHPCTIWARQSRANFRWLLSHMSHLFIQKGGVHKSALLIPLFQKYADPKFKLEYVIAVASQFGPHKVSVYGYGKMEGMEY